ncbi:Fibrous sheath-interacting protein 1 [Phytophthora cinnamomi]|uniref:Fibrous sheath-interacting protein 1 n=1 Tax=Phytophthora cinnamomi TaxID=4785 RepID=UPI00355A89E6|nr:Fibrous sheath-interacting protein 1 [Phytophthora cinnamomi]
MNQPRRPNTTPKPRIQRLLPAPGQSTAQDWHSSPQHIATTLAHLPDSPPRLLSERSIDRLNKDGPKCSLESAPNPVPPLTTSLSNVCNNYSSLEQCQDSEQSQPEDENTGAVGIIGPLLTDIHGESSVERLVPIQDNNLQDSKDSVANDFGDDNEYEQALATRKQLLSDEANRQRIRDELETYVNSLSSRTDENGEHLVEFPRNYKQVVSLMTQKDVREEDNSQDGNQTRQSWSRVLIESGLSKQQAFGILVGVDEDPEGSSSLAAKIAFKMARIRQLDTVLEEKLGKNLYSSIVPRKQKRAKSPPQLKATHDTTSRSSSSNLSSRTFVTQTQASIATSAGSETGRSGTTSRQSVEDEVAAGAKKTNNFIERNKQVVANGMKGNMTKDEEDRLEALLREEVSLTGDITASDEPATCDADGSTRTEECNEFAMADAEKRSIEELIASKSGAYPLFAIDELQDGPTDDALPPSDTRPAKDSIIQETKRERLQRQRLSRVEQELRFLEESPSVVIVGDDHGGDENDDCRSEKSFVTVASSTCSTRSGVISRHEFKCFLALQKESFHSTPTASAEEIRRLLLSLGHGTSAPSTPMTATTG